MGDDFEAGLESLPTLLQRNYGKMRDLDSSLQALQSQNEQRCRKEIEDIKRRVESGNTIPDKSRREFSKDALEEQKHCITISDEKLALAGECYELVDAQIRELDQHMRKLEAHQQQRELAAGSSQNNDGSSRSGRASESSRGGRKKSSLAAEPQPILDLDLPVDPNEPTYCFCNQVSFGEMVGCDNPDCKIEWFHFVCVGLKEQPKGKWYCSNCSGMQKRRKGK